MVSGNISAAISAWSNILPLEQVCSPSDYPLASCIASNRKVIAILYPQTQDDIIQCLQIAQQFNIAVYPVSTGNNWGYGSSMPVTDHCVIFNLSRMQQVIDFNPANGLITLEPGVTQRHLEDFLKQYNYSYLIPVTGAGPDCSIIGNAIERGYGITPYSDHFFSIMSLKSVLPDGAIYQPALNRFGGKTLDNLHKWGIGPYLDGLFTQSNLGIVTQMTIRLAPMPESVEAFFFGVKNPDDLKIITQKVQTVLKNFNGLTGSVNLMNQLRVLSMVENYPRDQLENGLIPEAVIEKLSCSRQIMPWTGTGALYGNRAVIKAAKREIRKVLRPTAQRLMFFSPKRIKFLNRLVSTIPFLNHSVIAETLETLQKTLQLLAGTPSEIALPLAYWLSGERPSDGSPMNPAKDGCGLIWYSPLVEMTPEAVERFTQMVKRICIKHKIEPLITLTSLSDLCFDSTIPLLFNKNDPEAVARAKTCYEELFYTGRELGFVPYRLSIDGMKYLKEFNAVPDIALKIKKALDPDNIMAPGRYINE